MSALTPLSITVIYDNNPYDKRLKTAWGFSALVEYGGEKILFDTGGDGATLLENMRILMIDPTHIDRVVLSHAHGDHTGGLSGLLDYGARPVVYLLPSFPETFKTQAASKTEVIEVMPGQPITEHMFTTGAMGRNIPEQALVIQTDQGLVVITGCAHPGIVEIVQQARDLFAGRVHLVLGGFHLRDKSTAEIKAILRDFRQLEVELAAPCHCTGEQAIAMFAAEYKENFIQVGVGRVIRFDEIAPKE
ncbi:MAG: MBL fold metallo-hydrolase [Anaerolineales bacterium]|nr:MBL fold metallo-hydrolase [Anaerolineales bacterium]